MMQSATQESSGRLSHPGAGERARLQIEGLEAPIVTTVARRRDDGLVVVQPLPFLKLQSAVHDEQGRAARIARVAVDVQRDVPRLVLELMFDPDAPPRSGGSVPPGGSGRRRDATVGYEIGRVSSPETSGETGRGGILSRRGLFGIEPAFRHFVHRVRIAIAILGRAWGDAMVALRA